MSIQSIYPTSLPDVNALIQELLQHVQRILGSHLIGLYLDGSLASGDFDHDSDIDFVVVTDEPVSENVFLALQAMHERIMAIDSPWALHLEGSYMSQNALRHSDSDQMPHPNIAWGSNERLKMLGHDETWDIHRWVLRERGITVVRSGCWCRTPAKYRGGSRSCPDTNWDPKRKRAHPPDTRQ